MFKLKTIFRLLDQSVVSSAFLCSLHCALGSFPCAFSCCLLFICLYFWSREAQSRSGLFASPYVNLLVVAIVVMDLPHPHAKLGCRAASTLISALVCAKRTFQSDRPIPLCYLSAFACKRQTSRLREQFGNPSLYLCATFSILCARALARNSKLYCDAHWSPVVQSWTSSQGGCGLFPGRVRSSRSPRP